jgi:hypothetical protein
MKAHTTFTARKATSRNRQMEGILTEAHTTFTAHKAASHANNLGRGRRKEWSAWGVREKKTHLGGRHSFPADALMVVDEKKEVKREQEGGCPYL